MHASVHPIIFVARDVDSIPSSHTLSPSRFASIMFMSFPSPTLRISCKTRVDDDGPRSGPSFSYLAYWQLHPVVRPHSGRSRRDPGLKNLSRFEEEPQDEYEPVKPLDKPEYAE